MNVDVKPDPNQPLSRYVDVNALFGQRSETIQRPWTPVNPDSRFAWGQIRTGLGRWKFKDGTLPTHPLTPYLESAVSQAELNKSEITDCFYDEQRKTLRIKRPDIGWYTKWDIYYPGTHGGLTPASWGPNSSEGIAYNSAASKAHTKVSIELTLSGLTKASSLTSNGYPFYTASGVSVIVRTPSKRNRVLFKVIKNRLKAGSDIAYVTTDVYDN